MHFTIFKVKMRRLFAQLKLNFVKIDWFMLSVRPCVYRVMDARTREGWRAREKRKSCSRRGFLSALYNIAATRLCAISSWFYL